MFAQALQFAAMCHKEQVDKANRPYIYHVIRVAELTQARYLQDSTQVAAALLHDVVEDTEITIDIIHKFFGRGVGEIVDILTRKEGENYFDYIRRTKEYSDTRFIKEMDIKDNLGRIGLITDNRIREGLHERYMNALEILNEKSSKF